MERFIGLDVHAASSTLAVMGPSGRRLRSLVVETNAKALVDAVRSIGGQRRLCMEEGTQSEWLYEVLSPHVAELVVAGMGSRRSYGQKSDRHDAFDLAEALRTGAIKTRVHKGLGRYKGRLKALYRSWGVSTAGQALYGRQRGAWLARLDAAVRPSASILYQELDALSELRVHAREALIEESHRHPITSVLETAPGMGPIRVAEVVSIVVAPHRFRTSRQFWSYCGLGLVMRSSSDWKRDGQSWVWANTALPRGLNRNHNATLKAIFKGAATTVVTQHRESPLGAHYDRLVAGGTKPNLAKVTLARKIAAITLAMWKNEEEYDSTRHRVHQ
jgi:transposase